MNNERRTTEIEWKLPEIEQPPRGTLYMALLPHQYAFQSRKKMSLHVVQCYDQWEPLVDQEGNELDWYEDAICWWAPLPDFMFSPGWPGEQL